MEASSVTEVRRRLQDTEYNIEYIQKIFGPFLDYEMKSIAFSEAQVQE